MPIESSDSLAHAIRVHVERVLRESRGPQEARRRLGIGRTTLYRWLRMWKAEDAGKPRPRWGHGKKKVTTRNGGDAS